jgi:flagellar L-ring protein precursor FlgH
MTTKMTATVTNVLPNGNLMIQGMREVVLNDEQQIIVLTGIVRPQDVSQDNTVLSTYIANARIEYTGSGVVTERQSPGWADRILTTVWPF